MSVPRIGTPGGIEPGGELQRRLAAELDDHPFGLLDLADPEHVLERQRLEVQPVGGVVVGRDGLRVAVDHHRVAPGLANRLRGVHAAVVELDPLPDPVRSRAEDHDARAARRGRPRARGRRAGAPSRSSSTACCAANSAAHVSTDLNVRSPLNGALGIGDQLSELAQEPRVDARARVELVDRAPRRSASSRWSKRSGPGLAAAPAAPRSSSGARRRSRARASAAPSRTPA